MRTARTGVVIEMLVSQTKMRERMKQRRERMREKRLAEDKQDVNRVNIMQSEKIHPAANKEHSPRNKD